jgi:hypothetical protein
MQSSEEGGDASIAKDLPGVAFVSFGEFFFECGFSFFECTAQHGRCDEEGKQKDRPWQPADTENDRAGESGGDCSAFVETAGFVSEEGDEKGEEKSEKELHETVESQRSKVRDWKSDF